MLYGLKNGLLGVLFASRKVFLPIPCRANVLEVGSGDSPCPRANVLLDANLDAVQRWGGPTRIDRPFVLGNVEHLPFGTKAFDFVVAFHILEHCRNPELMLSELERVAKAGYIETPSFWHERAYPLPMHRLAVGLVHDDAGAKLIIYKKEGPIPADPAARAYGERNPFLSPWNHVTRYRWSGTIRYEIINPAQSIDWEEPEQGEPIDARSSVRKALIATAYALYSPRHRPRVLTWGKFHSAVRGPVSRRNSE